MPPSALQLLIALVLAGLTFAVGGPLSIGGGQSVDALDAFLLVFALVNLRLGWNAANTSGGGRAPGWFVALGLLTAALITYAMIHALTPRPEATRGIRPAEAGDRCLLLATPGRGQASGHGSSDGLYAV